MSAATATRSRTRMDQHQNGNGQGGQVAVIHPPRLPYHDLINERFGVDKASWKALTEAIFPNAKTSDAVVMALSYCRARKLDPFKRPVNIVPMWSAAANGYVETVWPGISELRTTAFRTGQYAGKDETEFGPAKEQKFSGRYRNDEVEKVVTFPEWGRVKMKRVLNGVERVFVSPKVYWLETYGRLGSTTVPNDMWAKRPYGQFEKCVEAAGLRCAFPEELGNDYTAEEMEGRILDLPGDAPKAAGERPTLTAALDGLARSPGSPPLQADATPSEPPHDEGAISLVAEPEHAPDEPSSAEPSAKRPPRIDLELALKQTRNAKEVLDFLQNHENTAVIAKFSAADRKLWDTAVLQHQDDLKNPER